MKIAGFAQKQIWQLVLSFTTLYVEVTPAGEDLSILLWGGDKPHIGCCVLAVPRLSLTGNGTRSCSSSVLNVTGHRDEELCRMLAEKACKAYGCTVCCCGGVHVDEISLSQIQELIEAAKQVEWV